MPTKLVFKDTYLTPDEFIEQLKHHFEQLPSDLLFRPEVNFFSCDKNHNETVVFNEESKRVLQALLLNDSSTPYHKGMTMKTIVRDKKKAN